MRKTDFRKHEIQVPSLIILDDFKCEKLLDKVGKIFKLRLLCATHVKLNNKKINNNYSLYTFLTF